MKKSSENSDNDLLRQWLSGDATRRQEKQLEEKTNTDPFLADAMEGFRAFPEQDFEKKMMVFQQQLKQRTQTKKEARIVPFYWSRVAAMLAFVVVAGGAFWFLNQNIEQQQEKSVAMEENFDAAPSPYSNMEPQQKMDVVEDIEEEIANNQDFGAIEPLEKTNKKNETPNKKQATKPRSIIQKEEKTTIKENTPTAPFAAPIAKAKKRATEPQNSVTFSKDELIRGSNNGKEILNEENNFSDIEDSKMTFSTDDKVAPPALQKEYDKDESVGSMVNPAMEAAPQSPIISESRSALQKIATAKNTKPNVITGIIKDDNGEPVIGATVLEVGTRQGVMTDFDGHFQLEISSLPNLLDISYVGYATTQIQVNEDNQNLDIQLQASDVLLNEVVVSGMSKKNRVAAPIISKAKPAMGFNQFKKYIKNNMQLTDDAANANIKGKVIVQFKINRNGTLSDFKIIEGLGYGLEQEAIRLLKEGGRWELPIGQSSAIETYTFKFKK